MIDRDMIPLQNMIDQDPPCKSLVFLFPSITFHFQNRVVAYLGFEACLPQ